LHRFAKENPRVVTGDSLIMSQESLETLAKAKMNHIQHWNQHLKSKNLSPEARKQSFSMLAVDMDTFQYLTWRLENPDQLKQGKDTLDVNGALVTKALENS